MRPLAIDLYAGLGGWTEGLLAEGYDVVGFDIERHEYGAHRYPAHLVVQDVLTLHGSQFKDAALIVASPPCQEYSYMAMPWKLAKAKAAAIRADTTGKMLADLNRLFEACFRIQAQASLAAGRHIPMVVENVRGAQPWVGRARWNFGSFYLWGDVPALMIYPGIRALAEKGVGPSWDASTQSGRHGMRRWTNPPEGFKSSGVDLRKVGFNVANAQRYREGIKCGGDWFNADQPSISRLTSSKSDSRKAASAMIAKIPLPLSRHIASIYANGATP